MLPELTRSGSMGAGTAEVFLTFSYGCAKTRYNT
jgi:hypothetical protein